MNHIDAPEEFIKCYFNFIFINILMYDVVPMECLPFNFD